MSSAILERRRSGAVLWERSCMAKLETGAAHTMYYYFNPSPLQFQGQRVTSRLRSGLESSKLYSMLTNKTNPVKERRKKSTAAVLKKDLYLSAISSSRELMSGFTMLRDFLINVRHQISEFTYTQTNQILSGRIDWLGFSVVMFQSWRPLQPACPPLFICNSLDRQCLQCASQYVFVARRYVSYVSETHDLLFQQ